MSQFPAPLREVAIVRLIASLGVGGVLYLTPLVFHQGAFSATQITTGLALAALAGTGGRLLCGALLDQGLRCSVPVLLAAAHRRRRRWGARKRWCSGDERACRQSCARAASP